MDKLLGGKKWDVVNDDCIEVMHRMPESSVDFAVFSPPFPALYAYTNSVADIGNVDVMGDEAQLHLGFFYQALARVLKPGRVAVVHVMQIPRMKRTGEEGLCDFRGINIRLAERRGLTFEYDWAVRKNPQAQAIRTKSRELQFAGLESDRSKQRGSVPDYLLKFRKAGENAIKINARRQVSRDDWIKWAECTWDDINETDTLNLARGRDEKDVKHICPLQLEVIRRLVLLYTNPGEIVFSPFTGIGSEGFVSLGGKSPKTGRSIADQRRFFDCELKKSYFDAALENLRTACEQHKGGKQRSLFDPRDLVEDGAEVGVGAEGPVGEAVGVDEVSEKPELADVSI